MNTVIKTRNEFELVRKKGEIDYDAWIQRISEIWPYRKRVVEQEEPKKKKLREFRDLTKII